MKPLTIIKIGGKVIDNPAVLQPLLQAFAQRPGYKIMVHGGGNVASQVSQSMGITPQMHEGRRITNAQTLNIAVMVYGGLINKQLVAALQAHQCQAIGLTGADANLMPATKRPPNPIDFGFVGDVTHQQVNTGALITLLEAGLTPVVAPLTHSGSGQLFNTNADTMAATLAMALAGQYNTTLYYCFEKPGVLANPANDASVIKKLTPQNYQQYKANGTISAGMLPKLSNAFAALQQGAQHVMIGSPQAFIHNPKPFTGTLLCNQ